MIRERDDLENFGKEKLEGAELDLERMRGKYNKKNDLLDEYEAKLQENENLLGEKDSELERLNEELANKGSMIDDCVRQIQELGSMERGKLVEKEERVMELENLLQRGMDKSQVKTRRLKDMEQAIMEIDNACNVKIHESEIQAGRLREELRVKDNEIKVLLVEMERQKSKAQEGLENFKKLFV